MKNARNVILLGSTAVVMILVLGYLLVISPLLTKMQAGKVEYEEAQASLAQAQSTAEGLETYRTQEPQVSSVNEELAAQFPTTADVSALNAQVVQAATSAGLSPSAVSSIATTTPTVVVAAAPTAPTPAEGSEGEAAPTEGDAAATDPAAPAEPQATPIASMEVSISAIGPVDSLIAFARALGEIDRVLLITDVSISNESADGASISIKAIAYLYEPIQTVDAGEVPAEEVPAEEVPATEETPAVIEESGN